MTQRQAEGFQLLGNKAQGFKTILLNAGVGGTSIYVQLFF